jgi:hypothetical protein
LRSCTFIEDFVEQGGKGGERDDDDDVLLFLSRGIKVHSSR